MLLSLGKLCAQCLSVALCLHRRVLGYLSIALGLRKLLFEFLDLLVEFHTQRLRRVALGAKAVFVVEAICFRAVCPRQGNGMSPARGSWPPAALRLRFRVAQCDPYLLRLAC